MLDLPLSPFPPPNFSASVQYASGVFHWMATVEVTFELAWCVLPFPSIPISSFCTRRYHALKGRPMRPSFPETTAFTISDAIGRFAPSTALPCALRSINNRSRTRQLVRITLCLPFHVKHLALGSASLSFMTLFYDYICLICGRALTRQGIEEYMWQGLAGEAHRSRILRIKLSFEFYRVERTAVCTLQNAIFIVVSKAFFVEGFDWVIVCGWYFRARVRLLSKIRFRVKIRSIWNLCHFHRRSVQFPEVGFAI